MTYGDPIGPQNTVPYPGYPGRPDYPAYPFPPAEPVTYPAPAVNTSTFNITPKPVKTSAKIFTDIDEANEFMDDAIVTEVVVESYETSSLEGLVIIVYFEVEEDHG